MPAAIRAITRLQDADDLNVTLGAGVDEYALSWDNDTARFVLRTVAAGVTDHGALTGLSDDDHAGYLLETGARTGASAAAQPFAVGVSLADTTTSTSGVVFKGASVWLHNFHHPTGNTAVPVGRNVFLGQSVGNFTLGSTATSTSHGSQNIAIGYDCMAVTTIGYNNVAIGAESLKSLTTGYRNLGVGYGSLRFVTTGYQNVAVGATALWNATGYNNVAIGDGSLFNCTGYSNVGIGAAAGQFQADGATALAGVIQNVYIGSTCRGYNNSDANSIVIGYAAVGLGVNTTVIGTTSTTAAMIYGAGKYSLTDATTNAVVPMLTLTKSVTGAGVGAAGLGPGILLQAESSTTVDMTQARIVSLWNDAADATFKADLVLSAYDKSGEREGLRIRGNGSAPAIGFLSAAPIARIAHVADPAGGATVDAEARSAINSILATLEGFGLHATA